MKRSLADCNALPAEEFTALLGGIYEHSPWIVASVARQRPFSSIPALKTALQQAVDAASEAAQLALIRAHPDLAGKLAREGRLTPFSAQEQAASGILSMDLGNLETLLAGNAAYRTKFGFPFIICARRHSSAAILAALATRLRNDPSTERSAALTEIHHIAQLRLDDLLC